MKHGAREVGRKGAREEKESRQLQWHREAPRRHDRPMQATRDHIGQRKVSEGNDQEGALGCALLLALTVALSAPCATHSLVHSPQRSGGEMATAARGSSAATSNTAASAVSTVRGALEAIAWNRAGGCGTHRSKQKSLRQAEQGWTRMD